MLSNLRIRPTTSLLRPWLGPLQLSHGFQHVVPHPLPPACAGGTGLPLPPAVSPHCGVSQQHAPTHHSPRAAFSLLYLQRGSSQAMSRLWSLQMSFARQGTSTGPRTRCQPSGGEELPVSPSAAAAGSPQQIPSAQGQTGAVRWFLGIFHHDCSGSC